MAKLAFLDTETTGLNPYVNELLEFAAILYPENREVHFSLAIDPTLSSGNALEVNHYWERQAELKAIEVDQAAAGLILAGELDGRIVVANNPTFDCEFLSAFLARQGFDRQPWHYHPVDVKAIVAGKFGIVPPWNTARLCALLDIEIPKDQHTALADARLALRIFQEAYKT